MALRNKPFHTKPSSPIIPWRGVALGIGIVIIGVALFFFLQNQQPFQPPIISCASIDRSTYGLHPAVFDELPAPNACVLTARNALRGGNFTDIFFFTPADYLQPEFYGNFEQEGVKYWTSPSPYHYGAVGFGAFPQDQDITLSPGESKRLRVFLHAGFGVRTTQGLSISPKYGHPLDAERVQVDLSQEVREGFVLGPTFPKFSSEWVKPIDFVVSVAPTSGPGTITIGFTTQPPSNQMEAVFRSEYGFYFNGTDYIGSQIPFQVQVKVVPKR